MVGTGEVGLAPVVNGATSRIIYTGAFVMLAICLVGDIVLAMQDKAIPTELSSVTFAVITFLLGAHIKPPVQGASNAEK